MSVARGHDVFKALEDRVALGKLLVGSENLDGIELVGIGSAVLGSLQRCRMLWFRLFRLIVGIPDGSAYHNGGRNFFFHGGRGSLWLGRRHSRGLLHPRGKFTCGNRALSVSAEDNGDRVGSESLGRLLLHLFLHNDRSRRGGLRFGGGLNNRRLLCGRLLRLRLCIARNVNLGIGNLVGALLCGLEGHECIEKREGNLGLSFIADHESLLGGVADETHLGEHRRTRRFVKHEELGLLHTAVDGLKVLFVLILDGLSQIEALVDESILEHGEHHIALCRVGVETLVGVVVLVIALQQYVRVFLLGDLQVGTALGKTHHEGLHARGGSRRMGVGMDGDKKVGLVAIGNMGTFGQGDVDVGSARVDDFHIGVVVGNQLSEFFCNGQGDMLLLGTAPLSSGFCSPVTWVYDHCTHLVSVFFLRKSRCPKERHCDD